LARLVPDGKQIAFVRFPSPRADMGGVHVVSPLGGVERRLLDFAVRGTSLSWSPDGRWLAAAKAPAPTTLFGTGIYLIPTAGGEPRQATFPDESTFDTAPAFSPDGSALGYVSCQGAGGYLCHVWTLSLDAKAQPHGEPRRLTQQGAPTSTVAWTRDGRFIIYGADWAAEARLWRVRADGSAAPERVELAGPGAFHPSTVRCCDRLAYVRDVGDTDSMASTRVQAPPSRSLHLRSSTATRSTHGTVGGLPSARANGPRFGWPTPMDQPSRG
jgi:Tol biopolymer transport system component